MLTATLIEESLRGYRGYRAPDGLWCVATGTVTEILAPTPMDWIIQEDLDEGSACHKEMEEALKAGVRGEDPFAFCTRDRVKRFLGWFYGEWYELMAAERPEMNRTYRFAGRPDVVARGPLWNDVLEVKFAESIVPKYYLQIESYQHLDPLKWYRGLLVQVPKVGPVRPIHCKPDPGMWNGFLSGLGVIKWRMR